MPQKRFHINIAILMLAVFIVLFIGAVIFSSLENWSLVDAFYFVTMTATTVGYGDLTPTSPTSKIFTIIFSLSIVPFVLYAFGIVAKYQVDHVYQKIRKIERKQHEQTEDIDTTEKKINAQRRRLKQQEDELDDQEEQLDKQNRKIKKEVKVNEKQEETIAKQGKKIKKHTKEIKEHDVELEVVEEVVEEIEEIVEKK